MMIVVYFMNSSRLTIELINENTAQYYLAYLNIPVEYIRFDNELLYVIFPLVLPHHHCHH